MRVSRTFLWATLAMAAIRLTAVASPVSDGRLSINLDKGWRFLPSDSAQAQEAEFDDQAWQPVDIPHTWNALDGQDGGNNYRRGAGWYRRHILLPSTLAGRRLYLQFDGACLMADVYVNGFHLGNHKGGFARFRFDATSVLRLGADNVIAVRVDNGELGIPPASADFTLFGGLYRDVSLLATDPVHISTMDRASPGVFIEQQNLSAASARIIVRAELVNNSPMPREVDVRVAILDTEKREVHGSDTAFRVLLGPDGTSEVLKPLLLANPRILGRPEEPLPLHGARRAAPCRRQRRKRRYVRCRGAASRGQDVLG